MGSGRFSGSAAFFAGIAVLTAAAVSWIAKPARVSATVEPLSRPAPSTAVDIEEPRPPPGSAAPAPVAVSPHLIAANAALEKLTSRMRSALEGSRAYKRYRDCVDHGSGRSCLELWSGAMFSVLNTELDENRATVVASDLLKDTGDEAFAQAVNTRLRSDDPVDRVTTLALLNGNPHLKSIPVDPAAYEGLKEKSVVEVYLLLRRHEREPLPDADCARKVADVVSDSSLDSRERIAALAALGNPRDGEIMAGLATHLLEDKDDEVLSAAPSLIGALTRCGAACAPVVAKMAEDSRPAIRSLGEDVSTLTRGQQRL